MARTLFPVNPGSDDVLAAAFNTEQDRRRTAEEHAQRLQRDNDLLREAVEALEAKGKTYPPLHMAQRIDELDAEVERLQEALRLIRGRYFPADDDARIAWANETFKIARDALGDDR